MLEFSSITARSLTDQAIIVDAVALGPWLFLPANQDDLLAGGPGRRAAAGARAAAPTPP